MSQQITIQRASKSKVAIFVLHQVQLLITQVIYALGLLVIPAKMESIYQGTHAVSIIIHQVHLLQVLALVRRLHLVSQVIAALLMLGVTIAKMAHMSGRILEVVATEGRLHV